MMITCQYMIYRKYLMSWWRNQMETFSVLPAVCTEKNRSPVNSRHKSQWRGALMFSLICTRINGWENNGEAGDLRRHRAHYDATVMVIVDIACYWTLHGHDFKAAVSLCILYEWKQGFIPSSSPCISSSPLLISLHLSLLSLPLCHCKEWLTHMAIISFWALPYCMQIRSFNECRYHSE